MLARGSTHRAVRTPFLVRLRCRLQGKPSIGGEGPLWLAVLSTSPRYAIDLDRFILGTEARRCASRIDLRLLAATLSSGKRRRPRLRVPPAVLPVTRGPASGAPLRGAAPQPPRQARRAFSGGAVQGSRHASDQGEVNSGCCDASPTRHSPTESRPPDESSSSCNGFNILSMVYRCGRSCEQSRWIGGRRSRRRVLELVTPPHRRKASSSTGEGI